VRIIYLNPVLIVTISLVVLTGLDRSTFAGQGELSIEGFGGGAIGPKDENFGVTFRSAFGGGAGIGYEVVENLQLRVDLGYYRWGKAGGGTVTPWTCNQNAGFCVPNSGTVDEKLYDAPIFLGGRYFLHLNKEVSPFFELGMTANSLEAKYDGRLACVCVVPAIFPPLPPPLHSEVSRALRFGVAPGFGVRFMIARHVDLGLSARYDLVQNGIGNAHNLHPSFLSVSFFAAYRI